MVLTSLFDISKSSPRELVAEIVLRINVSDFDLAGTLECGQAFRWQRGPDGWFTGVVGGQVWQVRQERDVVAAVVNRGGNEDSRAYRARLQRYLVLDVSLPRVVATFPDDGVLQEAVKKHWGLRVLRQEPWETLASFIASSTKQIVQIEQQSWNSGGRSYLTNFGVGQLKQAIGQSQFVHDLQNGGMNGVAAKVAIEV